MSETPAVASRGSVPGHYWVVASLTLAWAGFNTIDYVMARVGTDAPLLYPAEWRAYLTTLRADWHVGSWSIAQALGLCGAATLLTRRILGLWALYAAFPFLLITVAFPLAFMPGRGLADAQAWLVSAIVLGFAALELIYFTVIKRCGMLR